MRFYPPDGNLILLPDVRYSPSCPFNLFSATKTTNLGWRLTGNEAGYVFEKDGVRINFNLKVKTLRSGAISHCLFLRKVLAKVLGCFVAVLEPTLIDRVTVTTTSGADNAFILASLFLPAAFSLRAFLILV